ncbi:hypothetical protein A2223_03595 [Candidatus Falkowbacteria bacterium RIFOXYA2_FULL_35_8]|uniref:histidine kinase n=1 Tax=Candidatus Falkowbacteria bacterium RIFOXYC2_FULL_36_12 TaxID=1798002 RepID=A0A1F5SVZ6_9BACT|nr:MAG: hypothetical protein A2478_00460 [Candidatus Falkowbacteria bacterium RIFOXYC2_FULL_36_12]OGF31368.1 MAG: hypothetical protein A2300_00995 [Candidatus Falkowbacteria bacterium RIFOXYB2_FULL_35_7]OGF33609.1 MAG: hypothetical protein A2223_03595 [Candidatus Falkowbacteria bacterium RIFOXYA2_FULL_35_8]
MLFFLVAIIPLVISSGWAIYSLKQVQEKNLETIQLQIQQNINENIADYFQQKFEVTSVQVIQDNIGMVTDEQQRYVLQEILNKDSDIQEVSFINSRGVEGLLLTRSSDFVVTNKKYVGDQMFKRAIGGDYFLGRADEDQQNIIIATPVVNSLKTVVGVIKTKVKLKNLESFLPEVLVAPGAYAYIVDSDRNILAYLGEADLNNFDYSVIETDLLSGKSYIGLSSKIVSGSVSEIGNLNWLVVVEWPAVDIYQVMQVNLIQIGLVSLIALFIVVIVSLIYSNRVSNNLNKLIEGIKILSEGNTEFNLIIPTNDELEQIAENINQLVKKDGLKVHDSSLEDKIILKNQDLENKL